MTIATILVGIDDSEGSKQALLWSADLAKSLGAKVVAVEVFEPLAHLAEMAPGSDLKSLRQLATGRLEQVLSAPLRERGIPYVTRMLEGNPAAALADAAEAERADLVVVGARRLSRLQGMVLGSTSLRLPTLSHCPVAIVPAPRST